jgi:hypothetical protein
MVVGAEEVVEKSGIYSDGIPRECRRDNGFGRVTERFIRFGTRPNYNLSRGPGGTTPDVFGNFPGTTTALDITQHFL